MNTNIREPFDQAFRAAGFTRKSNTWYLDCDESILVANLQKSQYGDQYYVNLAVWLKRLGKTEFPKEHHCPIRTRLEGILDRECKQYFDAEDCSVDNNVRREQIRLLMDEHAIPFLRSCSSIAGLAAMIQQGGLRRVLINKAARALLES